MHDVHSPILLFAHPAQCVQGVFIARRKRFFMDVLVEGKAQVAHTNNTGSMLGLLRPGKQILLSPSLNPLRKTAWTVEAMGLDCGWAGVNTSIPNKVLPVAWRNGLLDWLAGYNAFQAEKQYGSSRIDGFFSAPGLPDLWVECKNVSLVEDEVAAFPDAVSARGLKHLQDLSRLASDGRRAAMLYVVQRPDARCFAPADHIDPAYAAGLAQACQAGVEIRIIEIGVKIDGIYFMGTLPIADSFIKKAGLHLLSQP